MEGAGLEVALLLNGKYVPLKLPGAQFLHYVMSKREFSIFTVHDINIFKSLTSHQPFKRPAKNLIS